jgi:hypothetical protein
MTLSVRSKEGQEGYADCFHGLHQTARRWLAQGRTLDEFVAWMTATAALLPAGSYEPDRPEVE